jgi:hypothetical protein
MKVMKVNTIMHDRSTARTVYFLAASTECSAGSNDHFVVGVAQCIFWPIFVRLGVKKKSSY